MLLSYCQGEKFWQPSTLEETNKLFFEMRLRMIKVPVGGGAYEQQL